MANKGVRTTDQKNQKKTIVAPVNTTKTTTPTTSSTSYQPFNVQTTTTQPTTSLVNEVRNLYTTTSTPSTNTVNKAVAKTPTTGGVSKNTTQGATPVATQSAVKTTPSAQPINTKNPTIGGAVGAVAQTPIGSGLINGATNVTIPASIGATGIATATNPEKAKDSLIGALVGATPEIGVGNQLANAYLGAVGTGQRDAGDMMLGAYGGGFTTAPKEAALGGVLTAANNANRNNARRTINLQDSLERAARQALVNGNEDDLAGAIEDLKPYTEVPFAGSLYSALLGNSPSVVDTNRLPDETKNAYRVMENSVRNTLDSLGIPGTYTDNVFKQILDPSRNPINGAINNLINGGSNTTNGEGGNRTSSTSNGGGGRSTGRGGSGSIGLAEGLGGLDLSALYDLFNSRLNEYDNNYNSLMDALMEMYGANSSSLEDAYAQLLNALGLNYSDSEGLLRSQYENSQAELEESRRRQLQEAYISRMMQQKNLADQLDALGLTGGASETLLGSLLNNYANNRASVEDSIRTSLRDLLNNYMTNQSNARQRYNESLINAQQKQLNARQDLLNNLYNAQTNALNTRANMRDDAYNDLYNTLASLVAKGYQI